MMGWDMWKKGFDAWEGATARYVEQVMKNPLMLGPSGAMLTAGMKAKAQADKAAATYWGAMGLPTKPGNKIFAENKAASTTKADARDPLKRNMQNPSRRTVMVGMKRDGRTALFGE